MNREDGGGFLAIDGPFMRTMELVLNMFLLNVLFIICSLPIVTLGASMTAMNHQLYRMSKNYDGYVVRGFFKSFKDNFKVATPAWGIMLIVGLFLGYDLYFFSEGLEFPSFFKAIIIGLAVIYLMGFFYVFPVIARFDTKPITAIKYAYTMSMHGFGIFKSLVIIALYVAPWIAAMYIPNFVLANFLFGFSLPAYISVFLYRKTFEIFEKKQAENIDSDSTDVINDTDDESIFVDESKNG